MNVYDNAKKGGEIGVRSRSILYFPSLTLPGMFPSRIDYAYESRVDVDAHI